VNAPVVIAHIPNGRESVRIALDHAKGEATIDIRLCVEVSSTSGVRTPTKAGITLPIDRLPVLRQALQAAEAEARKRGLLRGGA
jgi:hypothetical protein